MTDRNGLKRRAAVLALCALSGVTGPGSAQVQLDHVVPFFSRTLLFEASPPRGERIPEQLVFTPYHASGIYDEGETVGWTVTPGPAAPTYAYRWTIRRNNAVVVKEGTLDLSSGKAAIEIAGDRPGMI